MWLRARPLQWCRSMHNSLGTGRGVHPAIVVSSLLFVATVVLLLASIAEHSSTYFVAAMLANSAGITVAAAAITKLELPRIALASAAIFTVSAAMLWREALATDTQHHATVPLAVAVAGLVTLVIVATLAWSEQKLRPVLRFS